MYRDRSILVIVPARGGSKGVPLKNIRPLCGRPLIAWVGKCLETLELVDRAVVSTDHEEIAAEAEAAGMDAPFRRPSALSGDRIGDLEVLVDALNQSEAIDGRTYDVVVMLQPTSPLRQPQHVRDTITRLIDGGYDAVWTVSPTDLKYHPLKQLTLEDGRLDLFDPEGRKIIARQQLRPVYHRNGVAYAFTRECLLSQQSILGRNSSAVVIDEPMVSIDTVEDFVTVERVMGKAEFT